MEIINQSPLCHKCGEGKIYYIEAKKCNRCYQSEWALAYYHKNKEKMRERAKLWSRNKKRKLGKRLPMIDNLWSQQYDCCVECQNINHKHQSNGLCTICYDRKRYPKKHKKYLNKLYSNKEFHNQQLEKFKKYNKKLRENPEYVKKQNKRQIKYYYKNADEISKKNKKKYNVKMKKLKKQIGKIKCEECEKEFTPPNRLKQIFCSYDCSQNNYKRLNEKILKAKARISRILNNKRIIEKEKENRLFNKSKKREGDKKYYVNNYQTIRKSSRIREIFCGKLVSMDRKDFEDIVKNDIEILKEAIQKKKKELNKMDLQKPLFTIINDK